MTRRPAHTPTSRAPFRVRASWVVALIVLLPLSALPAAANPSSSKPGSGKTTFTVGFTQDIDSLNPFIGITAAAYEVYGASFDALTGYSQKDFSPVPGLAESWTTSKDGLTWTYKIRSGLKWSDGKTLTANDVAYTYNRIMKNSFEQINWGNYVANIRSVRATDDTTVVMQTKKPTPTMLRLAVPILPEHVWKGIDEKKVRTFEGNPVVVGSGPFIFEQRKVGQFVKFRANPNYWAGAPKIDELVFRIFNNDDSMVQALRKGEIDLVDDLSANLWQSLKGQDGITTVAGKYSGFNELAMNTGARTVNNQPIGDGHPALKDLRVRQAIAHAINRKALVDRVLRGHGTPGSSFIPPLYATQHYDPGNKEYDFDPAQANKILDDAGYKRGPDGIRRMPGGGRELKMRLFGRQESSTSQKSVPYMKGWLRDIGIAVDVSIISENRLTEVIGNGEFDMFEWGWVVEPDPDYQLSTFTCDQRSTGSGSNLTAGLSDSFYCNKAYDALYQKQKTTIDIAARNAIVKQAQAMVYQAAPYVITFYYDDLEAYRSDRFTNLQQQPEGEGTLVFQYGTYTYRSVAPVGDKSAGSSGSGGSSTPVVATVGGLLLILLAGGGVVAARRRNGADNRE